MAAISSAAAATAAMMPSGSSHGEEVSWEYSNGQVEDAIHYNTGSAARTHGRRHGSQNGIALSSSYQPSHTHGFDLAARKMHSVDNLSAARWDNEAADGRIMSPPLVIESKTGRAGSSDRSMHGRQHSVGDERKRSIHQTLGLEVGDEDDSKWIHRDKLAKIESAELQAAGIFVPRSRAPSKQRRERSQSRVNRVGGSVDMTNSRTTHANDASSTRPWNDSAALEQQPGTATVEPHQNSEPTTPLWDLRTPEEIAEEEARAYFAFNGKGGSRIPVAKASPAPIPVDYLEREAPAARRLNENAEGDMISYPKPRSRSASLTVNDQGNPAPGPRMAAKRSVTDTSPRKNQPRKTSVASKNGLSAGRPKTRSGTNKDTPSTRPSTRAGEISSASKQPEGDPPWMFNSYKPDPRLPPDQQLLPTVARRLQQEQWEKEGKFGDAYDKDFRPLNDNELLRSPEVEPEKAAPAEEENPRQSNEWPLKTGVVKSPTLRQGSYSTMPKISDKPPLSPMASPRSPVMQQPPIAPQINPPQKQDTSSAVLEQHADEKKGGCGCCVVM